jgi:hypothetical protein
MREIRTSGSMRGRRVWWVTKRASLLYSTKSTASAGSERWFSTLMRWFILLRPCSLGEVASDLSHADGPTGSSLMRTDNSPHGTLTRLHSSFTGERLPLTGQMPPPTQSDWSPPIP